MTTSGDAGTSNLAWVKKALEHRSRILAQVNGREMLLPGLPDVIPRVRGAIADPACSHRHLAEIVAEDPQLVARVMKVANAAGLYRGQRSGTLAAAVARLGYQRIGMLATTLGLMQLMFATRAGVHTQLVQGYGRRSQAVAKSAYALAASAGLNPDTAMLCGIVHAIGVLPVVSYARQQGRPLEVPTERLVEVLYPEIGATVLRRWQFAPEVVTAAAEHAQLDRMPAGGRADYADVVTAALVEYYRGQRHPHFDVPPEGVAACRRLGVAAPVLAVDSRFQDHLQQAAALLDS